MLFKLSNLNSNLALTLGYLNPALNNSALVYIYISYFATELVTKEHCDDPHDNLHNSEETSDWRDDQVITGTPINTPRSSASVDIIAKDFQTQNGGYDRKGYEDNNLK